MLSSLPLSSPKVDGALIIGLSIGKGVLCLESRRPVCFNGGPASLGGSESRVLFCCFLLSAMPFLAQAQTIPCATDSAGNPMSFNSEGNPYFCTITTTVKSDGSEDVRIDQPVVDQSSFEYKSIVFSPSDLVTITADGCVQTAGLGATWKKYVNPSGSNSGPPDGLYYGAIVIKGATTADGLLPQSFPGDALY